MRKNTFLARVIISVFIGSFVIYKTLQVPAEKTHYHANFAVFINGEMIDFSKDEFMHIVPCGEDDEHDEESQVEKAHLHDNIGNVVHVHNDHVLWADLFENLRFDLKKHTAQFYLNEKKVDSVLNTIIQKNDRLLVSVGTQSATLDPAQYDKVGNDASEYDKNNTNESCAGPETRSLLERFKIAFGL